MEEEALIESLKSDLRPVRPLASVGGIGVLWLLISIAYVLALGAALGPFRPGFADQLLTVPRFSLEMLFGVAALGCFLRVALLESIPGREPGSWRVFCWVLLAAWLASVLRRFFRPGAGAIHAGQARSLRLGGISL